MTEIPARARREPRVAMQLGLCIAALALASVALAEPKKFDPAVARRITVDDLKKRMDSGEKVVVLDTRSVTSGPVIKGATQAAKDQLGGIAEKLPRDKLIVCYCS